MPSGVYNRPKHWTNSGSFKKGCIPFYKIHPELALKGENSPNWKGKNIKYRSLHHWVQDNLGIPKKCEHCGKEWDKPKSIQWANKSHKYLKNLTDWISLCVPCHRKYDISYKRKQSNLFQ